MIKHDKQWGLMAPHNLCFVSLTKQLPFPLHDCFGSHPFSHKPSRLMYPSLQAEQSSSPTNGCSYPLRETQM